jgi:NADH:ubiquinone oxidoreductase subunit 2 (subunit N)
MFAIFTLNLTTWKGITFYCIAYTIASIWVFSVFIKMKEYTYDGFNALTKRNPVLTAKITIC